MTRRTGPVQAYYLLLFDRRERKMRIDEVPGLVQPILFSSRTE
jgi:hypothetical protein